MKTNDWLKTFFKTDNENINYEKIENVKNFAILWNLFERYFCDKKADLNVISEKIRKLNESGYTFPSKISGEYYDYFRNRYITHDNTNAIFESLNFRQTAGDMNHKSNLKNILLSDDSTNDKKVLACLIIIYRFRNNLFHGSKNIATIDNQEENFKVANEIIMIFLEFLKKSGKLNE